MSAFVKLTSVRPFPGGYSIPARTMRLDGVDYELPVPFVEISGPVVVAPVMETSEDTRAVSIRMDRWEVLHLDAGLRLPMHLADMATAVRAARDFDADPGISWQSSETDFHTWVLTWLEQERARAGGDR